MISDEGIEKALEDIETLKKELRELKTDYTAVVQQTRKLILELQQIVTVLKINNDSENICTIVLQTPKIPNKQTVQTQVITEASVAKQKIITSSEPIKILDEFKQKWIKFLRGYDADFVIY
jgi:hypothetical protein